MAAASVLVMTAFVVTIAHGPNLGVLGDKVAAGWYGQSDDHGSRADHRPAAPLRWAATGAISNSLGREQPAFRVAARNGGLIANNSDQRLTASFGDHGVLVRSGTATFGLQLLAYGAERHLTPVAATAPRADANRVLYSHGAVTEWYANGPLGVEQGFDVATEPAPTSGHELTIELGLRGNVQARADGSGGLLLTGPRAQQLRYTGLSASDADGRALHTALTVAAGHAFIHVQTRGAVYPLRIDPFIQVAKFGDPNPGGETGLGAFAVSVQGTTAAAAETPSTAITPHVVDVFVANSGRWELGATRVAQLTDTNVTEDNFGASLSLTPDGRTLAVGAPDTPVSANADGEVLVFEEPAAGWTNTSTPTATLSDKTSGHASASDSLGKSVSISADGTTIAAGVPGRPSPPVTPSVGAVAVFEKVGMHWASKATPDATLTDGAGKQGDQLGVSAALSGNGNVIVAGAWGSPNMTFVGEAQVFQQPSTGWATTSSPSTTLVAPGGQPNDFFGTSAATSTDAKTIVIGATGYQGERGAAFVFTSSDGAWTATHAASGTLMSSDGQQERVGSSVATDGKIVVSGTPFVTIGGNMAQGAAYVFVMPSAGWSSETETQRLSASDGEAGDGLGQSVGISNGTVIAAAPQASAAGATPNHQGFLYAFATFPATGIVLNPATPNGRSGWYTVAVNVAALAADLASPVAHTDCVLDPASAPVTFGAIPASCPFAGSGASVAADGHHAVYAASENQAGYQESPKQATFKIDRTPPTLACGGAPSFQLGGSGGLVPASVADATSGPAGTTASVHVGAPSFGRRSASIVGFDNAGNSATISCPYIVTALALRPSPTMDWTFGAARKFTSVVSLVASSVPGPANIRTLCSGHGCPFRSHTSTPAKVRRCTGKGKHKKCTTRKPGTHSVNLTHLFFKRHLGVGTKLTVEFVQTNRVGKVFEFKTRAGRKPSAKITCLAPGSNTPGRGC